MTSASLRTLLTLLLLCSAAASWARAAEAGASADAVGRWTIYHVSGVTAGTWSRWYAQGQFPIKVRFKCSQGSVIVNALNTDKLTQGVGVQYWDVEADQSTLEKAIASSKVSQNAGFSLPAGQSTLQPILRPELCSGAANAFVFGAVYS